MTIGKGRGLDRWRIGFLTALSLWIALDSVLILASIARTSKDLVGVDIGRWAVFDWMTNYEGGFVRRGLPGEIILHVSDLTGQHPQNIVLGLLVVMYAALLFLIFNLFRQPRDPFPALLVMFAPFLVMYEALTQIVVGRKEILLFIVLAAVALNSARQNSKAEESARPSWAPEIALGLLPLLIFSHEGLFAFSPYLVFFLLAEKRPHWRLALGLGSWFVAGCVCAGIALFAEGNATVAAGICDSLAPRLGLPNMPADCLGDGAIQWLTKTTRDGWVRFVSAHGDDTARTVGPALLLVIAAFVPLVPFLRQIGVERRRLSIILFGCIAASIALTLPLFAITTDWGRWVRINAVCCGLVLVAVLAKGQREGWGGTPAALTAVLRHPLYLSLVFAFATCWSLKCVGVMLGGGFAAKGLLAIYSVTTR